MANYRARQNLYSTVEYLKSDPFWGAERTARLNNNAGHYFLPVFNPETGQNDTDCLVVQKHHKKPPEMAVFLFPA